MKRYFLQLLIVIFFLCLNVIFVFQGNAQNLNEINFYTTNMGAYSNPQSKTQPGLLVELVEELCRLSGLTPTFSTLPWKRALVTIGEDAASGLIFPVIRTPEREKRYRWLIRPITDREVFIAKGRNQPPSTLEELKTKRIGVIRGSPFEKAIQQMQFPHIDIATDANSNAKKLLMGRTDYWFATYNTMSFTFRSLGYDPQELTIAYTVAPAPIYIAANKSFPEESAQKLIVAFRKVRKSAWYTQLLQRYDAVDISDE